jgi:beta-glucosidase
MAEGTRLGIPLVFKDNARNHVETDPRQGIGAGCRCLHPVSQGSRAGRSGALGEQFLKEGKATTGDMSVIKTFTEVMAQEYNAVGLRAAYTYMADLLTEPRWYRAHEVSSPKTLTSTPTS